MIAYDELPVYSIEIKLSWHFYKGHSFILYRSKILTIHNSFGLGMNLIIAFSVVLSHLTIYDGNSHWLNDGSDTDHHNQP